MADIDEELEAVFPHLAEGTGPPPRWLNLGDYGFDNRTSSYRVGACSSLFADGRNGGGSWYPGSTVAWAQASRMLTGWDNRVSSVYVY